ncbi:MAG TPA: aminoglycoside phosphotransferase family protein [Streptosporangiaceae bacterium]|jgi:aminoglycoside phosphotransferase (APT) family kinase protein
MVGGVRPAADVQVDVSLVRRLVAAQFPQWASLPVEPVESPGWDNTIFRLGAGLTVRLPRRRVSAEHVSNEHQWLPVLAPQLPLPVPVPLGRGIPGEGYPWPWTVCRWLTGELAALTPVADMGRAATSLGRFVGALQAIGPAGGRVHEFRGLSLAAHADNTEAAAAVVQDSVDVRSVLEVWAAAVAAPVWTGQPVWMHGDLHPANLLVERSELSGVLDFGLLGIGDPACDLAVAWTYLSADARKVFRSVLAVDDATWSRGRGWALQFGLRAAAYSADNPVLDDIGRYTLAQILADLD